MAASGARLLFSTGSLYPYDTSVCFAMASEAGYDGIEIMCDDRWTTRDPAYLSDLAAQHALPVNVVHTPFSPRIPGWKVDGEVGRIRQTLKLAAALGCESMVVHLPFRIGFQRLALGRRTLFIPWGRSDFDAVKAWIERDLPSVQRDTPIRIAIENMPARRVFGRTVEAVWWNAPDEWARVHDYLTLDTTHWATKGINPLVPYRAAAGHVQHIHLSNFENGVEHRLPSRGELDLADFLRALAADSFAGTISLELAPDALDFADMNRARQHLRDELAFCRAALVSPSPSEERLL